MVGGNNQTMSIHSLQFIGNLLRKKEGHNRKHSRFINQMIKLGCAPNKKFYTVNGIL